MHKPVAIDMYATLFTGVYDYYCVCHPTIYYRLSVNVDHPKAFSEKRGGQHILLGCSHRRYFVGVLKGRSVHRNNGLQHSPWADQVAISLYRFSAQLPARPLMYIIFIMQMLVMFLSMVQLLNKISRRKI